MDKKTKLVKISFGVPEDFIGELDKITKEMGCMSRGEMIRRCLSEKYFISEKRRTDMRKIINKLEKMYD